MLLAGVGRVAVGARTAVHGADLERGWHSRGWEPVRCGLLGVGRLQMVTCYRMDRLSRAARYRRGLVLFERATAGTSTAARRGVEGSDVASRGAAAAGPRGRLRGIFRRICGTP